MTGPSRAGFRLRPAIVAFLAAETTGAFVLLFATAAALVWANSAWRDSYDALWRVPVSMALGDLHAEFDLRHLVNEGLMTLFFFVVGLEIKRELTVGELASRRKAALPIVAALGGMLVPALIYVALNTSGPGQRGWGIPIATDIAFAVGVLALVGRGLPATLRVFLLSVAIVDDIGSIVVIAIFYTGSVDVRALAIAVACVAAVAMLWRVRGTWSAVPLVVGMIAAWLAVLASGVHPTIAGVVLGLTTPARGDGGATPAERLGWTFHPWTSYVVIPLFALANAGVAIEAETLGAALGSPVTIGIVVGLVLGKLLGVTAGAYVGVRAGLVALPEGVRWANVVAVSAVAGIGYTVSLFIADLSFAGSPILPEAKVGILFGSLVAGLLGAALLRMSAARRT